MGHRLHMLALSALLFALAGCRTTGPGDAERLEGTWRPVEASLGGAPFPDEVLDSMVLTLHDGSYIVRAGEQVDRGTVRIEPAAQPKSMDITGTEGPNEGRTFHAIYELVDDTLRVCYDLDGDSRPLAFESAGSEQRLLVVYRRAEE